MNASENNSLIKQLEDIISDEPQSIKAFIAHEALEYENVKAFFEDLLNHGCRSGMVTSLIYYSNSHKFFDNYYSEIEDLRYEYEDSVGQPIEITGDLKNHMAWFAFELTAYRLADELGLEI